MKTVKVLEVNEAFYSGILGELFEGCNITEEHLYDLFGSDPDKAKITDSFEETEDCLFIQYQLDTDPNTTYIIVDREVSPEMEEMLSKFYGATCENVFVQTETQTWDKYNSLENGIAYRGGIGYSYTIYEWIS